jgi:hypothetical protein
VVAPDELTAGLSEAELQAPWEARLLDEEDESIVDVLPKQLLESGLAES